MITDVPRPDSCACEAGAGPSESSDCRLLEGFLDLAEDLADAALRMHRDDIGAGAKPFDQRLGFAAVELEPLRDRVGRVVDASLELGALRQTCDRDGLRQLQ